MKAGTWVQVHEIVLKPEERTGKLPEDTKKVPLEMWVKGFLKEDAAIGDTVEIETLTGRMVSGSLVAAEPAYSHGFGDIYIPEMLQIGMQARAILRGEGE
ncbi:MAG: 2-amino-4-ketopentanoate thiolase [Firmicutes bacterium]|nr:2-amino-4-ketopentanoate thiolase [Bacillota bacterium]